MKGYKPKNNKPQIKVNQANDKKPQIICLNGQYYAPVIATTDLPAFSTATALWWEDPHDRLPKNNKPTK